LTRAGVAAGLKKLGLMTGTVAGGSLRPQPGPGLPPGEGGQSSGIIPEAVLYIILDAYSFQYINPVRRDSGERPEKIEIRRERPDNEGR
jgi:hypothetical protein